ncbi:MAG: PEPxxWA-CTERM sorting domain-containing protein [Pseudomonadota bacterium]
MQAPAPVLPPVPKIECIDFEPERASVEPFAETLARLMEPGTANERVIEKLIRKRQRRIRWYRAPPSISVAPEPASWLMMIVGFGAIGAALRRHRHRPQTTFGLRRPAPPQRDT